MTDETNTTESTAEIAPPFVENADSLALLEFATRHNEIAINQHLKKPSNTLPVLIRRLTTADPQPLDQEIDQVNAVLVVDKNAKLPAPVPSFATGPQLGPQVPFMPGIFYTTAEAEKKFTNGYIFTDGSGQRFKFIAQETQSETGTTVVNFWARVSCPQKAAVK